MAFTVIQQHLSFALRERVKDRVRPKQHLILH